MSNHLTQPASFMTTDPPKVGQCPNCGEEISAAWILVEYERNNGDHGIWAECPDCESVVSPED